jgi:heme A synthase
MSALPLFVYLAIVTWAIIESCRRWMTLLWIVVGLVATVGMFAMAGAIWPEEAAVLGHVALIPSFLVSALVGVNHMRSHRRKGKPSVE